MVALLAIQLVPYGRSHTNPPGHAEPAWATSQARAIAKKACFDCHSNETRWPWYSSVAPVSWLVQHDVDSGRQELNFSSWSGGGRHGEGDGDDVVETVLGGGMPPWFYPLMHGDAKLSSQERQTLADGLRPSLAAQGGSGSGEGD